MPFTARIASTAFCIAAVRVWPGTATRIAPSEWRVSSCASVTASTGGASMITKYCRESSSISSCMRREPSSSEGFGGICPAGSRVSSGTVVGSATSSRLTEAASSWDRPTSPSTENCWAIIGRRRSASTSSVGWPARAMTRARFAATVDLPSPGAEEVTTIERGGLSTSM